jgi:hypothetical protein
VREREEQGVRRVRMGYPGGWFTDGKERGRGEEPGGLKTECIKLVSIEQHLKHI